jgi:hypothetical protein
MSQIKEKSRGVMEQYPYSTQQLKQDNPNTSFPSEITEEVLQSYNVYPVSVDSRPETSNDKKLELDEAPTYKDGVWSIGWTVESKTEEEKNADESNKRRERDEALKLTDSYALTDRELSEEMATYRQDLRNLPEQEGFPYIDIPNKPSE